MDELLKILNVNPLTLITIIGSAAYVYWQFKDHVRWRADHEKKDGDREAMINELKIISTKLTVMVEGQDARLVRVEEFIDESRRRNNHS